MENNSTDLYAYLFPSISIFPSNVFLMDGETVWKQMGMSLARLPQFDDLIPVNVLYLDKRVAVSKTCSTLY